VIEPFAGLGHLARLRSGQQALGRPQFLDRTLHRLLAVLWRIQRGQVRQPEILRVADSGDHLRVPGSMRAQLIGKGTFRDWCHLRRLLSHLERCFEDAAQLVVGELHGVTLHAAGTLGERDEPAAIGGGQACRLIPFQR
jgi:hypothetical protein